MELKFEVQARIEKPVAEVFDAVYNPKKLTQYFTTGSASGPLDEGTAVMWAFGDYPSEFPVQVTRVVKDKLIALEWPAQEGGYNTKVQLTFEPLDARTTLVKISESGWENTQVGLESSYGNCHGWTQMSCSLKAFLEYGINLRKGFYQPQ